MCLSPGPENRMFENPRKTYMIIEGIDAATTGAPMRDMISEIWPFLLALIAALLTLTFLPGVVLWLPRLLGYGG